MKEQETPEENSNVLLTAHWPKAERKKVKNRLQEKIKEVDCNGDGEANKEKFPNNMKKVNLL